MSQVGHDAAAAGRLRYCTTSSCIIAHLDGAHYFGIFTGQCMDESYQVSKADSSIGDWNWSIYLSNHVPPEHCHIAYDPYHDPKQYHTSTLHSEIHVPLPVAEHGDCCDEGATTWKPGSKS